MKKGSVFAWITMISLVVLFLAPVFGGVVLPRESVVRGGLYVSEPYRSYDRKLDPYYDIKQGSKYFEREYPPFHHITAVEHDIKHQLAELERNLAAARPYLSTNPQILREAEEQLRTLQHIHAHRLLQGIESIRQLELQQEVLIHKVNAQLENSVNQLKHLAVLQQEISNKQKSVAGHSSDLPLSTIEASKHLTAELHAIEAAKVHDEATHVILKDAMDHAIADDAMDHAIAKDAMDHAIAKEVEDHAIAREVVDHAIAKEVARKTHDEGISSVAPTRQFGVSSDEGVFRAPTLDPRSTPRSDSQDRFDGEKPIVFEIGAR